MDVSPTVFPDTDAFCS